MRLAFSFKKKCGVPKKFMTEILIIKAKAKELIQKNNCNMGNDVIDALSKKVTILIKEGCDRAHENARKTLRGIDV
jgi:hypothetical protein